MTPAAASSPRSRFLRVRGLRLHVLEWAAPADADTLFVLHGWMDTAASFAPVVSHLLTRATRPLRVLAPDWRGCGYSTWDPNGYWFADYLGDLEALVDQLADGAPILLAGHSMGGQAASIYAGLRPDRVRRLSVIDSLGLPDAKAADAPRRLRRWLDELRKLPVHHPYASFDALAARVRQHHPRLTAEQAGFVARCWGREGVDGRVHLLADPRHRLRGPVPYHLAESMAVWREVTAPTQFLLAGESAFRDVLSDDERATRHGCFRDHCVEVLPGLGHMCHFESPQATADALATFLLAPACR